MLSVIKFMCRMALGSFHVHTIRTEGYVYIQVTVLKPQDVAIYLKSFICTFFLIDIMVR